MSRPRLLDLFCCQGGAAMGYYLAGFDVVGVDIVAQPRYPFEFVQADALEYVAEHGSEFDAIHASPPCHDHSTLARISGDDGTAYLLSASRDALRDSGQPYVLENVEGASMRGAMLLCGTQFGRYTSGKRGIVWLRRHRLFESNVRLVPPDGHRVCTRGKKVIGVYGNGDGGGRGWKGSFADRKRVMDIEWMDRHGLSQAIPPAYTEWIGSQLIAELAVAA